MAIRDIVKYGDPRLVARNEDVTDFSDPVLPVLVRDLLETGWAAPGGSVGGPFGSPVIAAKPLIASARVPNPGRPL